MPGPWVHFLRDPDYAKSCQWAAGDVIEMVCLDDDGKPQGFAVMVVEKCMKKRLHKCHTMSVSDKEYAEWLFDQESFPNPGLYRQMTGAGDDKEQKFKRETVIPVDCWRLLNRIGETVVLPQWVLPAKVGRVSERILDKFDEMKGTEETITKGRTNARGRSPPNEGQHPSLVPASRKETQGRSQVSKDLRDLRASLDRDPEGAAHKSKSGTDRKPRSRSRKDHSGRHAERQKAAPKSSSKLVPPHLLESATVSPSESPDRRRRTPSRHRGSARKRKGRSGSREAEAEPREQRERSPSRKGRKGRSPKGRKRESRSRSESTSSVFRVASSSKGQSSQTRLIAWAHKHPGRLAAAGLQKMEDRVGRDGEAKVWETLAMPPAAKSYYLRVLRPEHHASKRNVREMQTLCTVLDHLAQGRTGQAADIAMQRLKALEVAAQTGSWDRAAFLELVEPDDAPLVGKEEQFMVAKETELANRLQRGQGSRPQWPAHVSFQPYGGNWHGSGKGSPWDNSNKGKGKNKGNKGKGKGKKEERWEHH
jgi:hypothetical protein